MSDPEMTELLEKVSMLAVKEDASDVYFKADTPPVLKIEGELVTIDVDPLSPEKMEILVNTIMPPKMAKEFEDSMEANLVYQREGIGRFRVNIYRQRTSAAVVMRRVKDDILTFETLGLPKVLEKLALEKRGLVLMTGPTGSGKSTTLASMIKYRNENSSGHIITIEDPIEFLHKDIRCIVSQREVGTDTHSFKDALENALRQAPDVLLIGEMRDVSSVEAAVYFAETGHLVLSTLHSNNAVQTVERILQFFPSDMHTQILQQMSLNLRAVISQRLVLNVEGSRVATIEIMINNARIRDLIAKAELTQIKRELDLFHPEGMQSFGHSLLELFKKGIISAEECIRNSDNPSDMRLKMKTMPDYIRSSGREDERYAET